MNKNNPFTLSFGKEPYSFIDQGMQKQEIIDSFTSENPSFQACMITGVRGSGKTVMLTNIAKYFTDLKDWIVINLSPELDLLHSFAANLSNRTDTLALFRDAKINLSFLGLGLEIDGVPPITDITVAISKMLEKLLKSNKRVLITIDEAVRNSSMREFASMFQIYIRQELPLYLIMTGLYENIYELQNEKSLTFLYRAPKYVVQPLNMGMVAHKYEKILNINPNDSIQMAKLTKGYPFAFQALGYLCWKNNTSYLDVLNEYSMYLEEFVYEKLWMELSENDRKVILAINNAKTGKVEDIRTQVGKTSGNFSVYRDRLLKKGLIVSSQYGYLEFALPMFEKYVSRMEALM